MDQWKKELARALEAQIGLEQEARAMNCEERLMGRLTDYGREVALATVQEALDAGKEYINCKMGSGTPEAQAAIGDLAGVVSQCAMSNWRLLLSGNWTAYATAVFQCTISKLLGGGGSGGGSSPGGFQSRPVSRC